MIIVKIHLLILKSLVVGISGGIDSSVVSTLMCINGKKNYCFNNANQTN